MSLFHEMERLPIDTFIPGTRIVTVFEIEVRAIEERHDVKALQLARGINHLPAGANVIIPALPSPTTGAISTEETAATPLLLRTAQLYRLTGNVTPIQVDQLRKQLLVDPVVQEAKYTRKANNSTIVDVFFLPGVTDTLAESVMAGARMLGITEIDRVETGQRYIVDGRLSESEVRTIAEALFYNPVIQHYELHGAWHRDSMNRVLGTQLAVPDEEEEIDLGAIVRSLDASPVQHIPLLEMTDAQLLTLSKEGLLALDLAEMRTIQQYYREQGREPMDVELETLAQTWSEHCSHKTFKATIDYREVDMDDHILAEETIPNLLKHYLMRATDMVKQPWLISAFSDNAGIIRFTETHDVAFKVETHNHPSAIEPFGGANTGVGGVIRDVLGVSAQPIACTDILCFGPLDTSSKTLLAGVLSPRRIASGVVNGVRDYGNKMGIPTVNGAVLYDEGYIYNPLVFCGCLGLLPHGSHPRNVQPGDRVVVLGGRTGRDGIHGATFSSGEMSSESNAQAGTAVQIGAPITEKKVADVIMQARDKGLYHAITDCGAGGFSSAIGEMGAETGVRVELSDAPLKYQGLAPWEIWLSEAQERMVLAVPPNSLQTLLDICAIEEVEASVIGAFTDDHRLVVTSYGEVVADMDMTFLHDGRPDRRLEAVYTVAPTTRRGRLTVPTADLSAIGTTLDASEVEARADKSAVGTVNRPLQYAEILLALLRHPTIASKEDVVRRYDHEVQGATVLKPLVGIAGNGPGDAAVLQPIMDNLEEQTQAGIVLSNGVNPLYGTIDPYAMALNAVDEALRNLTAVGGEIERAALLDNFCWGNPTDPEQLGMLVRAVKGCYDAAVGFGTPFISGKDSLNNEYLANGERKPVIPTLLISAVGVIDDAAQTVDMSLKEAGNALYLVGMTRNELAGSHFAEVVSPELFAQSFAETDVPQVDLASARVTMKAVGWAIRKGLVRACHDLSEGGLAIAAAEMALAGLLGVTIDCGKVKADGVGNDDTRCAGLLFSESPSRFLMEVALEQQATFEAYLLDVGVRDFAQIGTVTDAQRFVVRHREETLMELAVDDMQRAWKGEREHDNA
jgi:phosphoribosylformylglycinamidine (FGAM) synthase-like enzyme/phosphoribosylformylglycinamidine (FGAM) synthase PurS component